ncbi:pentatricopeptide (PPR) repeat protein, partial [Trifolium pratense]
RSNIYASKGMWDGENRIHMMKSKGLRKGPGGSWIEIGQRVHMILFSKSQPQMKENLEKLEQMSFEIKKSSYLSMIESVLQDVEEQDKEQILCGHSKSWTTASSDHEPENL